MFVVMGFGMGAMCHGFVPYSLFFRVVFGSVSGEQLARTTASA
jgi:hypothetical protein